MHLTNARLAGMVLVAALGATTAASILGWPPAAQTALRLLAAGTLMALLSSTYRLLNEALPRHRMPRLHIALHVVPLCYFGLEALLRQPPEALFFLPFLVLFFITGTRTWRLFHRLFAGKVYRLFEIGNLQMLFYFPLAFILDTVGTENTGWLDGLMKAYFLIHFLLTAWIVPSLARDLRGFTQPPS
ncbi:MAG TPA: hypothetical protein ENJ05_08835 [Thiotrichales bacterium]|nr:hypothetical protein [Thiotrichales bacterium]